MPGTTQCCLATAGDMSVLHLKGDLGIHADYHRDTPKEINLVLYLELGNEASPGVHVGKNV